MNDPMFPLIQPGSFAHWRPVVSERPAFTINTLPAFRRQMKADQIARAAVAHANNKLPGADGRAFDAYTDVLRKQGINSPASLLVNMARRLLWERVLALTAQ